MNINQLFELVNREGASDLLISSGAQPSLRVNGQLVRVKGEALDHDSARELVYSVMEEEQIEAFEEDLEFDFSLAAETGQRFRVNCYYQKGGVCAAFRPIPEKIPLWEDLGLPEYVVEISRARQGLVLVTGPTGHGKTTTQATIVDLINDTRPAHIITIEDPIEYVHQHKKSVVDQREIGGDTHSFPRALKYVLRQDPDVILIGEMRDLETIQAALSAAETGHLVLATLHTNDAIQTVDRVIDVFPTGSQQQIRFQLSMVLLAILSQRLLSNAEEDGRVMVYELLKNTTAVANLIREGKTHQVHSVLETSKRDGMVTMDQSIKRAYLDGLISYEEAALSMRNPSDLD